MNKITINFVGDVMLGRLVNEALKVEPCEYPWGDTLDRLRRSDLSVGNLECALSDRGQPWSETFKVFHYRSDAKNITSLTTAGFDFLSLANNHVLDYDRDAFNDTIEILMENNIKFAGAGENYDQAKKMLELSAGNLKVGFLSFTDNEPVWAATQTRPGVLYAPIDEPNNRTTRLLKLINQAKCEVDILIVSAHWGPNWGYAVPTSHRDFAHKVIEAGADIIHGHSPHIIRGIELYRHKPIMYSCGGFVDDYAVDPVEQNDESGIFSVIIEDNTIKLIHFYPTVTAAFQANFAPPHRAEAIGGKLQVLSDELGTEALWRNEGYLEIKV